MADKLLHDKAGIHVYDPQANSARVYADLEYLQQHRREDNQETVLTPEEIRQLVVVHNTPYEAMQNAHAIAVLTEWDEFKSYDWQRVYDNMLKPAFVFDGRNILDRKMLDNIGFEVACIGKG